MSIFDRFIRKSKAPNGLVAINVEFTKEELEFIAERMKETAAIINANAPAGQEFYVHPKVMQAMKAKALAEYAGDCVGRRLEECTSATEMSEVLDKAYKAQMKAYAVHNLPVYLYLVGMIYEIMGETAKATQFFNHFIQAQEEFKPDKIDTLFEIQTSLDVPQLLMATKQKLG